MKTGIVNFDSFMPKFWDRTLGERAFRYDAFISHNRGDKYSASLVQRLVESNASVWYDNNADIRDKKIQAAVSNALSNSRFVLVCIDADFRDSPWCQAEYLPALETEKNSDAARVIVARMTPDAPIPNVLQATTRIECNEHGQFKNLLDAVTAGNRVQSLRALLIDGPCSASSTHFTPAEAGRVAERGPFAGGTSRNCGRPHIPNQPGITTVDVDARYQDCLNEDATSTKHSEVLKYLWEVAVADPKERHPQALMAVRQRLMEKLDSAELSETQRCFALTAALFVCEMPDSGDRADGLRMLLHLCEADEARHMRLRTLMTLASEPDDSIISLCFCWLERVWPRLTAEERAYGDLLALRDPVYLRLYYPLSPFIKDLSSAVRVKIFAGGLEMSSLPLGESMFIFEQQVDYILENFISVARSSGFDGLRGIMGISDLEVVLRDLDAMVFDRTGQPRAGVDVVAERYARLLGRIVLTASTNKGYPLFLMNDWVFDFVLVPLLWCSTIAGNDVDAKEFYLTACDVMSSSKRKEEVPGYKRTLATFKDFKSKRDFRIETT
ncbi:TIR domain-containing protein [Rhodoblastus acidophilus]|uniref:TIR domain-containing protein n=1 Tax=Rhodoblastus acidophilus TaxID=1074 RepID=A0A6N8DS19_RHOAC|nr:toll/interleukin-1 receptor domain-containing protein [Rhodoblastus acidophilus]MCW2276569.1 hypothetical protein [Rhodoblastus acidophilus]MTV33370.1 TIR domain-containing protein [Rhodoblastus acidophilus]